MEAATVPKTIYEFNEVLIKIPMPLITEIEENKIHLQAPKSLNGQSKSEQIE